jgi:hypothetical protein
MWNVVRDLTNDGVTVLLTTQYLEEADELADRIAVVDHGRMIPTGTPQELKASTGGATLGDVFLVLTGHEIEPAETTTLKRALQDRRDPEPPVPDPRPAGVADRSRAPPTLSAPTPGTTGTHARRTRRRERPTGNALSRSAATHARRSAIGVFCPAASHHWPPRSTSTYIAISENRWSLSSPRSFRRT